MDLMWIDEFKITLFLLLKECNFQSILPLNTQFIEIKHVFKLPDRHKWLRLLPSLGINLFLFYDFCSPTKFKKKKVFITKLSLAFYNKIKQKIHSYHKLLAAYQFILQNPWKNKQSLLADTTKCGHSANNGQSFFP